MRGESSLSTSGGVWRRLSVEPKKFIVMTGIDRDRRWDASIFLRSWASVDGSMDFCGENGKGPMLGDFGD